jgi:hypothetical protein
LVVAATTVKTAFEIQIRENCIETEEDKNNWIKKRKKSKVFALWKGEFIHIHNCIWDCMPWC